jgi:membrane protein
MRPVERLRVFFREDVWQPTERLPRPRRAFYQVVRVLYMSIESFLDDLCTTRAAALTFTTLLALVPVLALAFAVLRGLGWSGARLEALILDKMTLLSPDAIDTIVAYIDKINFTGLGVIGGLFLFVTFISVVTNVESAFNAIWDNAPSRTFGRRVVDYFGVMVVAPVLLAAAVSLTAAVESNAAAQWLLQTWGVGTAVRWAMAYAVWVVVWLLFAFLYLFVPNARARLGPIAIAGVIAGTIWQLTHWAYVRFQVGLQGYNAVYGTLAQLPLLMIWIYVSWTIVLFGAEIAWAIQTVQIYSRERRASAKSGQAFREWIAMGIAIELARVAEERSAPASVDGLSQVFDVPLRTVRDIIACFANAGLAHTSGTSDVCCYLSLAPERIPVTRVLAALRGSMPPPEAHPTSADAAERARELLEQIEGATRDGFGARTLKDVVLESRSADAAGPPRSLVMERGALGSARRDLRRGGA